VTAARAVVPAATFLFALLVALPATARAVGVVTLVGPTGDSLRTATPALAVTTSGFSPGEEPVSIRVMVSTRPDFATLVLDTSVTGSAGTVIIREPLTERTTYYFRASARDAIGNETFSNVLGPRTTIAWLSLVSPDSPNGSVLSTARPRFIWKSIAVESPPGPWVYDIRIINVAAQSATLVQGLVDTVYTPPFELDENTSYRWAVTARLQNGDTTRVNSVGSFVITSSTRPPLTLLYQNFPNPFPTGDRTSTCIWFDLTDRSQVSLEIRDLRGNLVRRLLMSSELPEVLPAGQYGRSGSGAAGCDPRFSWDGRADDGRFVPRGLYLLRLRTDRGQWVKKVYFKGH
jgi:hypothetical protein